eukprot:scpid70461/ scgid8993/ PiggyBac transposable element-derived protein 4
MQSITQLQQYWSTDSFSETPGFARIMKRDKFLGILQFLHFADNNDAVPGDRLAKLSPLTDMLIDIFKQTYVPQQFISIDEELVLFMGRLLCKQYIPSKRARFGVKVFALCDTSGYYWSASIYTGRPANPLPHTVQLGSTGAIVVHLMGELLGKGYHVYLDNWYTSLDLATYPKANTTGMCGTMRANRRGIPNELKKLDFPKAQYAFRRKGALLLVKLHDKTVIYLLSTVHNADLVRTGKTTRQGQYVKRLQVNHQYNSRMGGVDKNDAMVTAFSAVRRTLKWYVKVGFHFVEEAVQNAYITYRMHGGKKKHHAFVQKAVHVLVEAADAELAAAATPTATAQDRLTGKHFPEKHPATEAKAVVLRRCVMCTSRGIRRETRYRCKTCHNHVSLCVEPCFEIYHTRSRY